ncbi:MAG: hypothetical protein MGAcid_16410 [uncultured Acidilobus sp. MG]|nr:MAG: hypothetical protein MGAcid_16410 [uncultured Acidilobus sp. MG]
MNMKAFDVMAIAPSTMTLREGHNVL